MNTTGSLRTAYFGRTNEALSVRGLEIVTAQPGMELVSVSCGRKETTTGEDGLLQQAARAAGIPLLNLRAVRRKLGQLDLVVSFSNPVVFPADFIESVRWGVLNLHPAPLPEYRGCHGLEHALLEGATEFGATLHLCDTAIDTGPVVDQWRFPLSENDTAHTVWTKVDDVSLAMLARTLPRIVDAARQGQRVAGQPQDEKRARYFDHNSLPEEMELDVAGSDTVRQRQVRAYDHPRRKACYLPHGNHLLRFRWRSGGIVLDAVEPATS